MIILNSSIKVGGLTLKNRLVMPPMATPKGEDDGLVTEELCGYYSEKSQDGQLGLVITEHSYVDIAGKAHQGQLSIADNGVIPGLARLTEAIHRNNTPVFAQISHAGGRTNAAITGHEGVAPSAVRLPRSKEGEPLPQAMSREEIVRLAEDFAQAARRAKAAGYDGVEIHSAHSYLLNQFFSPLTNHRTDEYGGSLDGRIRVHMDIIQAVREAVGPGFPIAIRLAVCDFMEGGITLEDAVYASKRFAESVELLDISGGFQGYQRPGVTGQGYFADLTEAIKNEVAVPVVLTGGITQAAAAEELLQQGKADLIGVGRALLKYSTWAKEALRAVEAQ